MVLAPFSQRAGRSAAVCLLSKIFRAVRRGEDDNEGLVQSCLPVAPRVAIVVVVAPVLGEFPTALASKRYLFV